MTDQHLLERWHCCWEYVHAKTTHPSPCCSEQCLVKWLPPHHQVGCCWGSQRTLTADEKPGSCQADMRMTERRRSANHVGCGGWISAEEKPGSCRAEMRMTEKVCVANCEPKGPLQYGCAGPEEQKVTLLAVCGVDDSAASLGNSIFWQNSRLHWVCRALMSGLHEVVGCEIAGPGPAPSTSGCQHGVYCQGKNAKQSIGVQIATESSLMQG